ncbi:hypothetical protein DENSPDRAFT_373636 [Dentipellis sp. KUC8613]|nr:hypothetical protein DENSPDRAFT_373636 [Dentipellis sp. KUC8613]
MKSLADYRSSIVSDIRYVGLISGPCSASVALLGDWMLSITMLYPWSFTTFALMFKSFVVYTIYCIPVTRIYVRLSFLVQHKS